MSLSASVSAAKTPESHCRSQNNIRETSREQLQMHISVPSEMSDWVLVVFQDQHTRKERSLPADMNV